jgi:hypothetical protein
MFARLRVQQTFLTSFWSCSLFSTLRSILTLQSYPLPCCSSNKFGIDKSKEGSRVSNNPTALPGECTREELGSTVKSRRTSARGNVHLAARTALQFPFLFFTTKTKMMRRPCYSKHFTGITTLLEVPRGCC